MSKHLNIRIHGQVQGINFRYHTREKAQELGLAGFVRNEPDGTVYTEAEGEEEKLKEFLEWCSHGPKWAGVEKVGYNYSEEIKDYKSFEITYD